VLELVEINVFIGGDVLDDGVIIPFKPIDDVAKLLIKLPVIAGLHIFVAECVLLLLLTLLLLFAI
jgi:hypothetical protein